MAAIAKQCFAFLLLAALFSGEIAARESQFFNKVPSNSEKENEKDEFNTKFYGSEKEANFYNDNEEEENPNAFSGQRTANYELDNYKYNNGGSERAEEFNSKKNFNLYDNGNNYYNGQKQNSYNGGLGEAKFGDSSKYSSFESTNIGVQKRGMIDTRFLENGKYFYDVNSENKNNRPANKKNAYNNYQGQDLP